VALLYGTVLIQDIDFPFCVGDSSLKILRPPCPAWGWYVLDYCWPLEDDLR